MGVPSAAETKKSVRIKLGSNVFNGKQKAS